MQRLVYQISMSLLALIYLGLCGCASELEYQFSLWKNLSKSELNETNLKYTFSLISVNDRPRLKIEISLIMPGKSFTFQMPSQFLRKERLFDRIEQLKVSGPGTYLENNAQYEFVKVLHGEAGYPVKISYLLRPDDPKKPGVLKSFSAPIVLPDFLMFVGSMALIIPAGLQENPNEFSVELEWRMPNSFEIYNSFGARHNKQAILTSGIDLWDSLFIAGNQIRSYKEEVNGQPVYVTMEGHFNQIGDHQLVNIITRLLKTQRDTWQDNNFPYFLVNFMAVGDKCSGESGTRFMGTAHRNSFRAFFPSECALQPNMIELISHELNHMFIGKKLKMGEKRGQIDGKWFSEGWNDYFGRRLAYLAGVITLPEYFLTLNKAIKDYQLSNQRLAPLSKLVAQMYKKPYTTSQALEQLPYQQGELMAWELNKKIKEKSGSSSSLDDVLRHMLKLAEKSGGSKKFTPSELESIVDLFAPGAFASAYKKIESGSSPFAPPILDNCADLQKELYYDNRRPNKSTPVYTYNLFLKNGCLRWLK
jgi:predicted metalloprotease with PDZ domain